MEILKKLTKIYLKITRNESGQVGAEMILLIGGVIIIVLISAIMYKDYLINLSGEIGSVELNKLNQSINNLSIKFNSS
ncbi:hypothetical protein [Methanobrevibacter curvatus]|uniref:Class III signal peptide n=1 Tax=Methanobrevibacter curvatus TaxID=49547 RepID=A0A162FI82_9EURY|nr:hypothetical protein [Methanobrevibacter curvatus]KZX10360.1 hypothetical protein MBCUR_18130 [Methanobrevibacter curvatus]